MKLQLAVNIAESRVERVEEQVFFGAPANLNRVVRLREADKKAGYKNTGQCRTIFV